MNIRRTFIIGSVGGAAFSAWSLATMLWPVSYSVWDIGRSVIFVSFLVALVGLAASVARSRESMLSTFGSVAVALLLGAGLTLATYAISTGFFAHRILQLPEYIRDYTYHGYVSPQAYLAANYSGLLRLQVFSWTVTAMGLLIIAGTTGWWLRLCKWFGARQSR